MYNQKAKIIFELCNSEAIVLRKKIVRSSYLTLVLYSLKVSFEFLIAYFGSLILEKNDFEIV